jgi:hypothetical protein
MGHEAAAMRVAMRRRSTSALGIYRNYFVNFNQQQ